MDAPIKAYTIYDRTGRVEECHVVFDRTAREARKWYTSLGDVPYFDVAARRSPKLDSFAPGPVPVQALLLAGWHWECGWCRDPVRLYNDALEDAGKVVTDTEAFCDENCQASAVGRERGLRFRQLEREAVEADVRRRYPDALDVRVYERDGELHAQCMRKNPSPNGAAQRP